MQDRENRCEGVRGKATKPLQESIGIDGADLIHRDES